MCVCFVIVSQMAEDGNSGEKNLDFFYFCSKSIVEPLMSHGLFYRGPYYVSGPGNITVALLSMEGHRALTFHQKYFNFCSEDEG